ncbi:unnamed protein product [Hydatigera taeniaeformis]|uniref:General transcription factor 3C polypeptide 2 n=1 Tax=Hydatigena taeniaeformis TaxID=6205 RepID=A0A0R3X1Q1_HYDTA|nr:unnamed protein product [Hydatigera taeniaeformis]
MSRTRPRRLAAQKAMSSFVIPESDEDGVPSPKSQHSDFDALGEESSSSSTSSNPNSTEILSGDANFEDRSQSRRLDGDTRGPCVPPLSHILPPFGRHTAASILLLFIKVWVAGGVCIPTQAAHAILFKLTDACIREVWHGNSDASLFRHLEKYMPESLKSPTMVFLDEQREVETSRFHFDQAHNILYAGGYVKCLSWSPPYMDEKGVSLSFVPGYLAIACHPNIGTRVNLSDPVKSDFGLIHVWSCTDLALTAKQSCPQLKPHFFLAHDWGHVMDLRWLPVPVQCANHSDGCEPTRPLPPVEMTPKQVAQLIGAVVGHLIAACTDGFVRIFLVPAVDNRFNLPEEFKVVLPTKIHDGLPQNVYNFKPKTVLRLAPSTDIPSWLGWPNVLAIRGDFPHRLVVGYTSGHLGLYNLSTLNAHFAKLNDCLLRPIILTHLIPGPFTSIALHPLYEGIVVGLGAYIRMLSKRLVCGHAGLDREVNVWDLADPECVQYGLPELSWPTSRMGWGGHVVWPRASDSIWIGREEYLFPFTKKSTPGGAVTLASLKKPSDVPARMRAYTVCFPTVSPIDCSRYCFDRGFEATTCLDYSDSLGFLVQGDANGQINFHSWVLDPRRVVREKTRIAIQKKHRMYQWIMRKRANIRERGNEASATQGFTNEQNTLRLDVLEEPFEEAIRQNCGICGESGQTLCWHKVEQYFEFVFREGVGLQKSKYDFVNSTFSSISKVAVSPNPGSASWIAVGTGFGIVQLLCHEQFYHPSMDSALGRSPLTGGPEKGSFFMSSGRDDTDYSDSEATVSFRGEDP